MPKNAGFEGRGRRGWSARLGLGLAGPALAGAVLFPFIAFGEQQAAAHAHTSGATGVEAELAQVRAATARFHRVEQAVSAGYELGWVNGSGNRIVAESGGETTIEPGRPVLIEFWVLEVGGKPVVVEARQEGAPGEALARQLDQVRESLTFGLRQ